MRRRRGVGVGLIVLSLATMVVGVAVATPGSGVTIEPVAAGTVRRDFKIAQGDELGVVMARFTIAPVERPGGTLIPARRWSSSSQVR